MRDYDLNIFVREDDNQWYMHIYEVKDGNHHELGGAFKLSPMEVNQIIIGNSTFHYQTDVWYELSGFWLDYQPQLSDRILMKFRSLPR